MRKHAKNREENWVLFICLHVNVSTLDVGLAAGLAAGLVLGRRCGGGGLLTANQCRVSINLPLIAYFRRPQGKFSLSGSLSGPHGTQSGVPYQAAVYKQIANHIDVDGENMLKTRGIQRKTSEKQTCRLE